MCHRGSNSGVKALVEIAEDRLATFGWSDGGEISIDCYSELQNLYVSSLPSLTADLDWLLLVLPSS